MTIKLRQVKNILDEFNPYHGEGGRFSSGDKATFVTTKSKSGKDVSHVTKAHQSKNASSHNPYINADGSMNPRPKDPHGFAKALATRHNITEDGARSLAWHHGSFDRMLSKNSHAKQAHDSANEKFGHRNVEHMSAKDHADRKKWHYAQSRSKNYRSNSVKLT
jgi:hypothetical protein